MLLLALLISSEKHSKQMKPVKQPETKIIIVVSSLEKSRSPKKSKINPSILKAISIMVITLISWLNPEATIVIALIRLLFVLLEWLNQSKS